MAKQRQARLSLAELRSLNDSSPAVHYAAEATGKLDPFYVSESLRAQLRYEPRQFTRDPGFWQNHIHPNDREQAIAGFEDLFETGRYVLEYRFQHADGSWRWIHDEARLVRDTDDNPTTILGSWLDVTERKKTELALRESLTILERRIEEHTAELAFKASIVENMAEGVSLVRRSNYAIVYVNPTFEKIFGYAPGDLMGQHISILNAGTEEAKAEIFGQISKALDEHGSWSGEVHSAKKDGTVFWNHYSIWPMKHPEFGEVFVRTNIDITLRKQAEEQLRLSESRLNEIERIGSVGGWDWNIVTNELSWTSETFRIFGVDQDTFTPTYEAFLQAVHTDDRARVTAAVDHAISTGEPFDIQFSIVLPDKTARTVHSEGEITVDHNGQITRLAGALNDITELKKLEDQLRQAQKMQAVGQLTGGIAHNFNNLLAVIVGRLDVLQDLASSDEESVESLQAAMDAAVRGANLIDRLLAFSRQQRLFLEELNINDVVRDLGDLLKNALGERVQIQTRLAGGLYQTTIDRSQLESALVNLAINARDAMPDGGILTIETGNVELEMTAVLDEQEVSGGSYVMLAVSDSGTGIPKDALPHIFEPFFTTKDVGEGVGLGLSAVHGYVKQSKGHINVYSEEGHGTTMKIYLPRSGDGSEDQVQMAEIRRALPRGDETILLVEDEVAVRETAAILLRSLGYRVLEASNGLKAMDILVDAHRDIDLLLTDIVMPGELNGLTLADRALELQPNLKVLFTTGYTVGGRSANGLKPDSPNVLTKPYRRAELAQTLRDLLDRK